MNIEKVSAGSAPLHHQINTNIKNPVEKIELTKHSKQQALHHENTVHAEDVKTAVTVLEGFIDQSRTNLKFVYHEQLHEYYVTVVDPLTNETVKEIPPKKMLDIYAAMAECMGILIDKKI